jgi:predicted nucleic acid-binding protein
MAELAVVNASPLIFLGAADRLDLLRLAGDEVLVPKAVFREVTADQRGGNLGRLIPTAPWLKVVEPVHVPDSIVAWDLGAGEAAVLSLAIVHHGMVAIVDDLAGRKCARAHGISLKGTLGLVLKARQLGQVESARELLRQLRAVGMYLSDALVNSALAEVGE